MNRTWIAGFVIGVILGILATSFFYERIINIWSSEYSASLQKNLKQELLIDYYKETYIRPLCRDIAKLNLTMDYIKRNFPDCSQ